MQGMQFLQALPQSASDLFSPGLPEQRQAFDPFAQKSSFMSPANQLADILDLSPESQTKLDQEKGVLDKMAQGIEDLREQDAKLAKLRLEFLRREMTLIQDMMEHAAGFEQKKTLFAHLKGLGQRLKNVGSHVDLASTNAQKTNPASRLSAQEQRTSGGRILAYEEKLSVEFEQFQVRLRTERLQISDEEIVKIAEDLSFTVTNLTITAERTAIYAQNVSQDLSRDFGAAIKFFGKLARESAYELLKEVDRKEENRSEPLEKAIKFDLEFSDHEIVALYEKMRDILKGPAERTA